MSDLEACDSHQTFMATPPALASAWRAGEMVEDLWMALLRDVNFADYGTDPVAAQATAELNRLSDFRGPKHRGKVSAQALFRGCTPGDLSGPYVSQFLLQPFRFGALNVSQQYSTYQPGLDYMTDPDAWLLAQNGQGPFAENLRDPKPQYIRNGRDLGAYVHADVPYQAYLAAAHWMMQNDVPLNAGNPYEKSHTQEGFQTFGGPHVLSLLAEVSNRALKAVWYHKWYVHRTLRPEAYGGLVHWTMSGQARLSASCRYPQLQSGRRSLQQAWNLFTPPSLSGGLPVASQLRPGTRRHRRSLRHRPESLLRHRQRHVLRTGGGERRWPIASSLQRPRRLADVSNQRASQTGR